MAKRTSDSLVPVHELKRSKNELVAFSSRDKALLEAVSYPLKNNTMMKTQFLLLKMFLFRASNELRICFRR